MQVIVKFNAAPPVPGNTFSRLRCILTDAGGNVKQVEVPAATVAAQAQLEADGSYTLPVEFTGVAVGPYTVTAQAVNTNNTTYGPVGSGSGNVALADGVWYPAPTGFA
jgi:hypothetical protein